jgi:CheY-like chemotaxis protein
MNFRRILCVEDNTLLQQVLKIGLGHYGFEVVTACHGLDALMQYKTQAGRLGAIITDHDMPNMNGIEFVRSVRELGYRGRIVAMSGRLKKEDLWAYHKHAISGFFSKPFEVAMLAAMLLQTD